MTCPRSNNLPSTWLAAGQRLAPPHHRQRMHPRQRQAPSRTPCTARPIADPPWSAVPWVGVREGQGGDPEAPETARGPIEGAKGRASKPNWRRKCPAIPASPGAPSPFLCDSACSTTLFLNLTWGRAKSALSAAQAQALLATIAAGPPAEGCLLRMSPSLAASPSTDNLSRIPSPCFSSFEPACSVLET